MTVHLPNSSERLAVIGKTGSGKTLAGMWHLARRLGGHMPWLVYDFKGDDHLALMPAEEVSTDYVPRKRGLYITRPLPKDKAAVEAQLWAIWEKGNIGIYVDEVYMIDNPAFDAILTQGRSRRIPVQLLMQRPVWATRFAFSEADYIQVFRLNDRRDWSTVQNFTPIDMAERLPDYHSWYYDVKRDSLQKFAPVPPEEDLLQMIEDRVKPRRKVKII